MFWWLKYVLCGLGRLYCVCVSESDESVCGSGSFGPVIARSSSPSVVHCAIEPNWSPLCLLKLLSALPRVTIQNNVKHYIVRHQLLHTSKYEPIVWYWNLSLSYQSEYWQSLWKCSSSLPPNCLFYHMDDYNIRFGVQTTGYIIH